LSYSDFERTSKINIVNTINILIENNYIPIINENDTVATDEIQFGDNDKLAALTAVLLKVDILIIAQIPMEFIQNHPFTMKSRNHLISDLINATRSGRF
jgi:glutamate 5-kinase